MTHITFGGANLVKNDSNAATVIARRQTIAPILAGFRMFVRADCLFWKLAIFVARFPLLPPVAAVLMRAAAPLSSVLAAQDGVSARARAAVSPKRFCKARRHGWRFRGR
jgi:hypothetical protein